MERPEHAGLARDEQDVTGSSAQHPQTQAQVQGHPGMRTAHTEFQLLFGKI